jgi:hypothetical protein
MLWILICLTVEARPMPQRPGLPAGVVLDFCVRAELIDRRERQWYLNDRRNLLGDLRTLWNRYRTLHDAPPVCDVLRWPTLKQCEAALAFNEAFRDHLDNVMAVELTRRDSLRPVLAQNRKLREIWGRLRDARQDCYYVSVRRNALAELRALLGPADYYAGVMPPPAPLWLFQKSD